MLYKKIVASLNAIVTPIVLTALVGLLSRVFEEEKWPGMHCLRMCRVSVYFPVKLTIIKSVTWIIEAIVLFEVKGEHIIGI